jgi:hypothetical protein
MTTPAKPELRIVTYVGNTVRHTFEVRRFRTKGNADVSGATSIEITWEDEDGVSQPKLTLSPSTTDANWGAGLVVAEFTPSDFTAEEGTYTFALTGFIDGQEITWETGIVEVRERPGYPSP